MGDKKPPPEPPPSDVRRAMADKVRVMDRDGVPEELFLSMIDLIMEGLVVLKEPNIFVLTTLGVETAQQRIELKEF
jgi:hypothetical protein